MSRDDEPSDKESFYAGSVYKKRKIQYIIPTKAPRLMWSCTLYDRTAPQTDRRLLSLTNLRELESFFFIGVHYTEYVVPGRMRR